MITASEVKEIALNHKNFDQGLITETMIEISVEKHIIPLLTRALYDVVGNYADLNNHTRKALAFLVIFDHFPVFQHRLTSLGAQKLTQQNGQPVEGTDRPYTADYFRAMAQVYIDLITTQLLDYPTEYPEYIVGEQIKSGYGTGIIM